MAVVPMARVRPTIIDAAALAPCAAIAGPAARMAAVGTRIEEVEREIAPRRRVELIPVGARKPTLDLARMVADVSGLPFEAMLGERRLKPIAQARQITFFLCRRFTTRSLPSIGYDIGGKDHTTVLHGAKKVEAALARLGLPPEETPTSCATHRAWAEYLWKRREDW